ncbi:hypothetical protein WJX73_000319 [Symbiochloris irregularis]|uniref:Alanine--tRNA ligase n=1 Tax=Symbiochloris irregularis TaxID=706552 RepID=A0AAW1PG64_9CHLO
MRAFFSQASALRSRVGLQATSSSSRSALFASSAATLPTQWQAHLGLWASMQRPIGAAYHTSCTCSAVATEADTAQPANQQPPSACISGAEIRERFLKFFEERGHKRLPSSSLIPEDPTVLLTIAGMLQFKPIFLGQASRQHARATTTQKCVRTNDLTNVGVTARHHSFFEMLGNFSFGDYFKAEACAYAWELSTRVLGLAPERVWVSVYEHDDEAFHLWRDKVGVPQERIQRLGEDDNFWASGPTGPCGPCSELYYDFHPERGHQGADLNDDTRFIEFYNLVFMESNRQQDGTLQPLAAKNIDTGLGLERMAQILQGVPNNYETDLLFPILNKAAKLAHMDYHKADERQKTALKVLADHTRACTYLASDGVLPSNVGRGYVLRRLIRRVVMTGRLIGIKGAFITKLADVAIELSPGCDPNVQASARRIKKELEAEESRFSATLESGEKRLNEVLAAAKNESRAVSGPEAFMLYDTFGFPLEITQELASLHDIQIDVEGFEEEMEVQRKRSKDSARTIDLNSGNLLGDLAAQFGATEFTGYTHIQGQGKIVALVRNGQSIDSASSGDEVEVLLDQSPFYAESGGQVGDNGILRSLQPSDGKATARITVSDVRKGAGGELVVHHGLVEEGNVSVGQEVTAEVDEQLRARIKAHHTATHLLHAALKQVLGDDVSQQGSLVGSDRLRFDFNLPRGVEAHELERIEALVNGWVQTNQGLTTKVLPIDEARKAGAVAMFGEKYGEQVRVVDVPGVSMELCGGTHVTNTSEIGAFKVLSEGGIASGVRRVEAVAGAAAVEHMNTLDAVTRELGSQLRVRPADMPAKVAGLLAEARAAAKEVAELKSRLAVAQVGEMAAAAEPLASGARVLVARLDDTDAGSLPDAAKAALSRMGDKAAVVLFAASKGKVSMVAAFSDAVVKGGLKAGQFIGGIAKLRLPGFSVFSGSTKTYSRQKYVVILGWMLCEALRTRRYGETLTSSWTICLVAYAANSHCREFHRLSCISHPAGG